MKKIFTLLFLMAFTMTTANAICWVEICDKYYLDTDSIQYYVNDRGETEYDKCSYWTILNDNSSYYKRLEKRYQKKIWYTMCKVVLNIKNKRSTTKSEIGYDLHRNYIYNFEYNDYSLEWDSLIPGSNGEYINDIVMKRLGRR